MIVLVGGAGALRAKIGHGKRRAVRQGALPGQDAHAAHRHAAVDIQVGLLPLADGVGKEEVRPKVAAAVAGLGRQVGVLRPLRDIRALGGRPWRAVPLVMPDAHLLWPKIARPARDLHRSARAVQAVPIAVAGQPQAKDAEDRPVIHAAQDDRAGIVVARQGGGQIGGGDGQGVDRERHRVGDVHQGGQGMGAVIGRGNPVAPMLAPRRDAVDRVAVHRVIVFALGVGHAPDLARLVEAAHLHVKAREGVVFGEHVDQAGFLDGAAQRHALGQGRVAGAFTHHMLAGAQRLDGEGGVFVEIIGQDHGVHLVFEEAVVIGVGGHAVLGADGAQLFLPNIAQGDQLHADKLGSAGGEILPAPDADHADADGVVGIVHKVAFPVRNLSSRLRPAAGNAPRAGVRRPHVSRLFLRVTNTWLSSAITHAPWTLPRRSLSSNIPPPLSWI